MIVHLFQDEETGETWSLGLLTWGADFEITRTLVRTVQTGRGDGVIFAHSVKHDPTRAVVGRPVTPVDLTGVLDRFMSENKVETKP